MLLMIEYNVVGESSVREEMGNVIIQNKIRLKLHEAFYFDKDGTRLGC